MFFSEEKATQKTAYLQKHVFYGLTNLNDGFDALGIHYFSAADFQIVLERVEQLGLGITGIEPWKDGEFHDVVTYEMVTDDPTDAYWYQKVFEDFKNEGLELQYAASYYVPDILLES